MARRLSFFVVLLLWANHFSAAQSDTILTDSGIKYIILKPGKGPFAATGNKVWVQYTGKFKDGRIFDTSAINGKPLKVKVGSGEVIEAWEEILPKMQAGTRLILIAPTELAYGSKGLPSDDTGYMVPPDQDLIFEMELIRIKD